MSTLALPLGIPDIAEYQHEGLYASEELVSFRFRGANSEPPTIADLNLRLVAHLQKGILIAKRFMEDTKIWRKKVQNREERPETRDAYLAFPSCQVDRVHRACPGPGGNACRSVPR